MSRKNEWLGVSNGRRDAECEFNTSSCYALKFWQLFFRTLGLAEELSQAARQRDLDPLLPKTWHIAPVLDDRVDQIHHRRTATATDRVLTSHDGCAKRFFAYLVPPYDNFILTPRNLKQQSFIKSVVSEIKCK